MIEIKLANESFPRRYRKEKKLTLSTTICFQTNFYPINSRFLGLGASCRSQNQVATCNLQAQTQTKTNAWVFFFYCKLNMIKASFPLLEEMMLLLFPCVMYCHVHLISVQYIHAILHHHIQIRWQCPHSPFFNNPFVEEAWIISMFILY